MAQITYADKSTGDSFTADNANEIKTVVNGFDSAIDAKEDELGFTPEDTANKGEVNGYASLDDTGKVPTGQLPSSTEYTLPIASNSVLGGVKIGSGLGIAEDGTLSTSQVNIGLSGGAGDYTLALTDNGKMIIQTSGSTNNVNVPTNAAVAFPIGSQILVNQDGAGQTTIVAEGGVTINSSGTRLKLFSQFSIASLIKIATDTWVLSGDLTA